MSILNPCSISNASALAITFVLYSLFDDTSASLVRCTVRANHIEGAYLTMNPQPRTNFDWSVYADATLAGLSVLIPIPLLDTVFETFFRRRMPRSIARSHGRVLPANIQAALRLNLRSWFQTYLMLPLTLTIGLVRRLSRKLLYFLTIKEAADALSQYWHRAFLLDYMLAAGHLETVASAHVARQAMVSLTALY